MSSIGLFNQLDTILPKRTELFQKNKANQKNIESIGEGLQKIESVDDFIKDRRLFETVLTAYGLEDEINKIGLIKRVLTDDQSDPKALVNVIADDRYRELAVELQLGTGVAIAKAPSTIKKIEDRFIKVGVQKELNEIAPGIRQAIVFKETAEKGIIKNAYDLIANPISKEVVFGAMGLPDSLNAANADALAKTFAKRVDVERLDDPKYLDTLIKQYLVSADLDNNGFQVSSSSIVSLFGFGAPRGVSLSIDLFA